MTLYCENISAFNFFKNPIQHSRPKHIKHHFIRILVKDRVIEIKHIPTERKIGDLSLKILMHLVLKHSYPFLDYGCSFDCLNKSMTNGEKKWVMFSGNGP